LARQQLQNHGSPDSSRQLLLLLLLYQPGFDVVGAEQTTDRNSTKTTLSTRGAELGMSDAFPKARMATPSTKSPGLTSVNWIELGLDVTNTALPTGLVGQGVGDTAGNDRGRGSRTIGL
jgi:hypothetical protein